MNYNSTVTTGKGLVHFMLSKHKLDLNTRARQFGEFLTQLKAQEQYAYQRILLSATDREVTILDTYTQRPKQMLMFASNNYLGLANHPDVKQRVKDIVDEYGTGMGGPPLLNGYSNLMRELEAKIARFKNTEDAIIFPAGFMANLGVVSALAQRNDLVIHDQLSHASLHAGLQLSEAEDVRFPHNNTRRLAHLLTKNKSKYATVFAAMEGVYSMDGDVAPLHEMVPVCQEHGAVVLLDDAHGIGVLGANGRGTAEAQGVEDGIDVYVGTFSKSFAVSGGYITGRREIIDYLRYFARPYVFSAALPPTTLAAVCAGIDVIEQEPERRANLLDLAAYAADRLQDYGLQTKPAAAVLALLVPKDMNIRLANRELHERGIFVNAIEYPAVGVNKQRFRVSLSANHTRADIDALANALDAIWSNAKFRTSADMKKQTKA
ncbi:MAG: aminotransferase class I/II-fold pyridoxal phosphate-dependent enzyme [Bacteroidota bacterium]